jgi:hypothetical protein
MNKVTKHRNAWCKTCEQTTAQMKRKDVFVCTACYCEQRELKGRS